MRKLLQPPGWTSLRRKAYPSRITLHSSLYIRLLGVSDFDTMTRKATMKIDCRRRLKSSERAPEVLEDLIVVIVVIDLISLEH
ncbi:MAG: hypothetical protein ACKPKO_47870, partial [Candidatus Fonsibacter sp.]